MLSFGNFLIEAGGGAGVAPVPINNCLGLIFTQCGLLDTLGLLICLFKKNIARLRKDVLSLSYTVFPFSCLPKSLKQFEFCNNFSFVTLYLSSDLSQFEWSQFEICVAIQVLSQFEVSQFNFSQFQFLSQFLL